MLVPVLAQRTQRIRLGTAVTLLPLLADDGERVEHCEEMMAARTGVTVFLIHRRQHPLSPRILPERLLQSVTPR